EQQESEKQFSAGKIVHGEGKPTHGAEEQGQYS
ncbi:unnamed protein product, partial [marine sediment metagenome]